MANKMKNSIIALALLCLCMAELAKCSKGNLPQGEKMFQDHIGTICDAEERCIEFKGNCTKDDWFSGVRISKYRQSGNVNEDKAVRDDISIVTQHYVDGLKDGMETDECGGSITIRLYKKGKRHGEAKMYNKQKMLVEYAKYNNGRRRCYSLWNDRGVLVERCHYNEDGLLNGAYSRWKDNGKLESVIEYRNGIMDGLFREWFENGVLKREASFKDGYQDGYVYLWNEKGRLLEINLVCHDQGCGDWVKYAEDGKELIEPFKTISAERKQSSMIHFTDWETTPQFLIIDEVPEQRLSCTNIVGNSPPWKDDEMAVL